MTFVPHHLIVQHMESAKTNASTVDRARERKLYKKKSRKSQRIERLKKTIHSKTEEVQSLHERTSTLKTAINKASVIAKTLKK